MHSDPIGRLLGVLASMLVLAVCCGQTLTELPLKNASFEEGTTDNGVPVGWSRYGGGGKEQQLRLLAVASHEKAALLIADGDPDAEIGVVQTFPLKPNETYEVRAMVRRVKGAAPDGAHLQFRFLPSQKLVQTGLAATSADRFEQVSVRGTAPPGTTGGMIYLYTHKAPTPTVIVDDVKLMAGFPPPPPPPPDPIPPVYAKLKDLHLTTAIVKSGTPAAAIVAPASGLHDASARLIQETIRRRTGVTLPLISDESAEATVPIRQNLIVLGNRSTNRAINALYDLYYCLLDLKYPGPGGYVLRTLHDPFGNGLNVVLVGGSDAEGVAAAAEVLCRLDAVAVDTERDFSVGRLQEIRLGRGVTVPSDIREFETWEASAGYGSVGYFGWSSLSKRLAMYYMTGDEFHAREFVRLAFPDAQAIRDIEEIDGERIENKQQPLRGPYHYNAHMATLYWDLVEESPVFTDEERLRITNALATQLAKRAPEGIYRLTQPAGAVGSRHGQWAAISLYCLGRYFQKGYTDDRWSQCMRGAVNHFGSLHKYAWVNGESDNLFWYNTGIAPILTYMVLTGDRKPIENGVLQTLLRGQEALLSGEANDAHLRSASLGYLHKAAYLTGDGRWITYRERTGVDTDVFRLGQSFWPDDDLPSSPPTDLAGKWLINPVPKPLWEQRGSGIPLEHSVFFGSYRSSGDDTGDYVLIDAFNGASRNPYHTLALLHLRLNGGTLLRGYRNQVLTSADGMVEPRVAMDAALLYRNVLGPTAIAVGEVPRAAFCNWRRSLLQRTGEYSLIVDALTFRADSENMEVRTLWETVGGSWSQKRNAVRFSGARGSGPPPGWLAFRSLDAACETKPSNPGDVVRLVGIDITLLRANEPGSWIEMPFTVDRPVKGDLFVDLVNYQDRGTVAFALDGKPVGKPYDHYAQGAERDRVPLGSLSLTPGEHRLRVEARARHSGVDRCFIGLGGVTIRPEGAPSTDGMIAVELTPADHTSAHGRGTVTMQWTGSAKEGETRRFFYLIAPGTDTPTTSDACLRLDANAAALHLPEPAIIVAQEYKGLAAELLLLATTHLHGRALTRAAWEGLLQADRPVDLDWDFRTGSLHVDVREAPVELTIALRPAARPLSADTPVQARSTPDGRTALTLPLGRHELTDVVPPADVLAQLARRLEAEHATALELAAAERKSVPQSEAPIPSITPSVETRVDGGVTELTAIRWRGEYVLCAVSGRTASLVTEDGRVDTAFEADATIRTAHWWAEHRLLLLGCVDEKVIAYAEDGSRAWEFVSEMDTAVYRAAKTYWFKSAPGHAGVHALHTGEFLDGKSQCFVGSACTLEIIDERGQLVKRLPVFWGPGHRFALIDGPGDATRLLIAREPTDSHALAIVDNKKLNVGRGYYGVPSGHTYVGGWACMSRDHIFYDDINADGKPEIVSEINGTWNRITVWGENGSALHNAQFGPGRSIPARNIRDVDVVDLDGDGEKEIVAATANGLVVALSCRCERLWSYRPPAPPLCLQAVPAAGGTTKPKLLVGCEDGALVVIGPDGQPLRRGQVRGRPTTVQLLRTEPRRVALGTNEGQVLFYPAD